MMSMTIQVFAKFLNAMMSIPFCSTLLIFFQNGFAHHWFFFFFLEYCFQSKLVQFLFYFYLLVEQIWSYFFLFVFLVSCFFFFFFCQIYRLCSSSFNVGFFFFSNERQCAWLCFTGLCILTSVFLGTWSRCVRELQNNSLEQQSDMTLCGVAVVTPEPGTPGTWPGWRPNWPGWQIDYRAQMCPAGILGGPPRNFRMPAPHCSFFV